MEDSDNLAAKVADRLRVLRLQSEAMLQELDLADLCVMATYLSEALKEADSSNTPLQIDEDALPLVVKLALFSLVEQALKRSQAVPDGEAGNG